MKNIDARLRLLASSAKTAVLSRKGNKSKEQQHNQQKQDWPSSVASSPSVTVSGIGYGAESALNSEALVTLSFRNTDFVAQINCLKKDKNDIPIATIERIVSCGCILPALATIQFVASSQHNATLKRLIKTTQKNASELIQSLINALDRRLKQDLWNWNQEDGTFTHSLTHIVKELPILMVHPHENGQQNNFKLRWVWQLISQLPKLITAGFAIGTGLIWEVRIIHCEPMTRNGSFVVLDVRQQNGQTTRQLHREQLGTGTETGTAWKGVQNNSTLLWEQQLDMDNDGGNDNDSNVLENWQHMTTIGLITLHFKDFQRHPQTRRDFYQGKNIIIVGSGSNVVCKQLIKYDPVLCITKIQPNDLLKNVSNSYFEHVLNDRISTGTEDTYDRCFFTVVMFTEDWMLDLLQQAKTSLENPIWEYMHKWKTSCPEITTAVVIIHTRKRDELHVTILMKEALFDRRSERKDWDVRSYSQGDQENDAVVLLVCPFDYPNISITKWQEMMVSLEQNKKQQDGGKKDHTTKNDLKMQPVKLFQPNPVSIANAQPTSVVRIPKIITENEISEIIVWGDNELERSNKLSWLQRRDELTEKDRGMMVSSTFAGIEDRGNDSHKWKVVYLQSNGVFAQRFPNIMTRIQNKIQEIDQKHWNGIVKRGGASGASGSGGGGGGGSSDLQARVVEYHRQIAPGPGLSDERHYDMDSCITVDIVLSQPPTSNSTSESAQSRWSQIKETVNRSSLDSDHYKRYSPKRKAQPTQPSQPTQTTQPTQTAHPTQ